MYYHEPPPAMKQLAIRLPVDVIARIDTAVEKAGKVKYCYPRPTRSLYIRECIEQRLKRVKK